MDLSGHRILDPAVISMVISARAMDRARHLWVESERTSFNRGALLPQPSHIPDTTRLATSPWHTVAGHVDLQRWHTKTRACGFG
jgi:hypothetical protein